MSSRFSSAQQHLYKLLDELSQLVNCPVECVNAQILLSREISKIWAQIQQETQNNDQQNSPYSMLTPPPGDFSRFSNSFETPIKYKQETSSDVENEDDEHENDSFENSRSCHILQTKIYIPEPPQQINGQPVKCNYIGRILGPSGMSAKMIEKQYNVTLLIRGKGSVRNGEKESSLLKKKGFEHLNEQLHVLLIAKHSNREKCVELLNRAAEKVEGLLTPVHDELKRDQLLRLAVINGTYEQRTPKTTLENSNNSMCSF